MENSLHFQNRRDWRSWLEKNHDKQPWIWLKFYKKDLGKKGMTLAESVEEAICFGWIDGKLRKVDDVSFIVRFSPRKAKSVWSMINKERAERLIASGQMTSNGMSKIEEAKEAGTWSNAYTNLTSDKMPADLRKALMRDSAAWENFQNFANTYRNMYIGWIVGAKTDVTRKKRIAKTVAQALKNKKTMLE
jgi:uncharacterized protein YdeI (YjbR/CyaY-like superfamily)